MDELITKSPAHTRAGIKEAVLRQRRRAQQGRASGEHYNVDRNYAAGYLSTHPLWRRKVEKYLRGLKEPVYVDVCGRANGASLGASVTYTFSLQSKRSHFFLDGETHVEGDIFNGGDFGRFLHVIVKNGHKPAFVTFEPIAGLQRYTPTEITKISALVDGKLADRLKDRYMKTPPLEWDVTWQRLRNNLRRMIELVRPGGYIYLTRPFALLDGGEFFMGVPKTKGRLALGVQAFCQALGCEVEAVGTIVGPAFLIRKTGRKRAVASGRS